jgi:hypothetical protein
VPPIRAHWLSPADCHLGRLATRRMSRDVNLTKEGWAIAVIGGVPAGTRPGRPVRVR